MITYLQKYNTVWGKVSADTKNNLMANQSTLKNLKNKIKSYSDEVTDFYNKEIPKVDSNHTCLAVISLNSALNKDENYYLKVFLNECK